MKEYTQYRRILLEEIGITKVLLGTKLCHLCGKVSWMSVLFSDI